MTIQLNPTTSDAYETKTLAQLRQMIFDGMGFMNLFATTKTESLVSIRTDIFNMLGMAAMAANPPPGVNAMLNSFINEAQQTVFRAIESNLFGTALQFPPPMLVGDTDQTVYDGQIVRTLALGMAKIHYGQEDGQLYVASNQKYLNDLKDRLPPNAITLVNRVLRDTQIMLYREYRVFRMERWFTWTLQVGQRFYPIAGNDERVALPTPSGVSVTLGTAGNFGQMTVQRMLFGIAATPQSKFIVAGGFDGFNNLTRTDLYDPTTGIFTQTGDLKVARQQPITIALNDGLILAAGGLNGTYLGECELYDPTTGKWTQTGSMATARSSATAGATLLADGRVLVMGGVVPGISPTYINTGEVYDPNVGTWSATGNMTFGAQGTAVTRMANGNVLVAGGISVGGVTNNGAQIYNPTTNAFTATGNMAHDRVGATSVLLGNGKVLVTGGSATGTGNIATCEIYDPSLGTWSGAANMSVARAGHTLTVLPDGSGKVLAAGGTNFAGSVVASAEVYDPVANTWTTVPGGMASAHASASALGFSGKILVAGGMDNTFVPIANMDIYNPGTNTFSTSGTPTQTNRSYRVAARDSNGKTTLASVGVALLNVPAYSSVVVSWTPLTQQSVAFYDIFGRSAGAELYLGSVPATVSTFTDYGVIVPGSPAGSQPLPTQNTTGNTGPVLDQRELSWVGVSQGDVGWRPLSKPIPPQAYTSQTSGVPNWYDIREQIEIWPPSPDPTWLLRIKGYFTLGPFEVDTDVTTIDWQAVYLWALALTKAEYKRQDANSALARAQAYVGDLVAGSHGTARYIPGRIERGSVTRPVMTGTFPYS